jgi:hypothetical protein
MRPSTATSEVQNWIRSSLSLDEHSKLPFFEIETRKCRDVDLNSTVRTRDGNKCLISKCLVWREMRFVIAFSVLSFGVPVSHYTKYCCYDFNRAMLSGKLSAPCNMQKDLTAQHGHFLHNFIAFFGLAELTLRRSWKIWPICTPSPFFQ